LLAKDEKELALLNEALSAVQCTSKIAEVHNRLKPFKVLGMAASGALTSSVITTAISFYSLVFSMYKPGTTDISGGQ
jgi:hypothetical protein